MSPRFIALEFLVLVLVRLALQWRGEARHWKQLVELTLVMATAALLFVHFVVGLYRVTSRSMQPTLEPWDILVVTHFRRGYQPNRGDIVLLSAPNHETALVKRVIALSGDHVEVRDGKLWLNGDKVTEDYVHVNSQAPAMTYPDHLVAPQCVFVMGDNRHNSMDSRAFGDIPQSSILGRAEWICWPPRHFAGLTGKKEIPSAGANAPSGQEQSLKK